MHLFESLDDRCDDSAEFCDWKYARCLLDEFTAVKVLGNEKVVFDFLEDLIEL
jgi:hypothetical protein